MTLNIRVHSARDAVGAEDVSETHKYRLLELLTVHSPCDKIAGRHINTHTHRFLELYRLRSGHGAAGDDSSSQWIWYLYFSDHN